MDFPFLIGFSGKKNAGKSTLSRFLQEELRKCDISSRVIGFGYPLKMTVHRLFGVPIELLFGSYENKLEPTDLYWEDMPVYGGHITKSGRMSVRDLLQHFGTDIGRQMYKNVWCNALYNEILTLDPMPVILFIDDVRFVNECEWVKDKHGKVVRLTRVIDSSDMHESETALDYYDDFSLIINNHYLSLEDTKVVAERIILGKWIETYINLV